MTSDPWLIVDLNRMRRLQCGLTLMQVLIIVMLLAPSEQGEHP